MYPLVFTTTAIVLFKIIEGSTGDSSPYYQKCLERCNLLNCTKDGSEYTKSSAYAQPLHLRLTLWSCDDECKYECMWQTVEAFNNRNWRVPQFYGKWPFVRFLGIQEPASVLFSLLNLYVHYKCIKRFRKTVRPDSPTYFLWHIYSAVCINAWLWSVVFHGRDFPFTEFMDYSCAFSMVFISFYCMALRLLYRIPKYLKIIVSALFAAFLINHIAYLYYGRFDYGYNMKMNILIGTLTALCWYTWCLVQRKLPHMWKLATYVTLTAAVLSLEVFDYPPIFWVFDFHSLWHLSTAPIALLFYGFIIDDTKYLRKQTEVAYIDTEYGGKTKEKVNDGSDNDAGNNQRSYLDVLKARYFSSSDFGDKLHVE